ncbi:NB-ARC domain-containing protein [Streptomyces sp. NPDC046557]|uniref:tetratricopeptide repeat protein n=1 Tax=Streptomyces sp. NPDC046557 TaxID=3155372 RepID=UPI0033C856B5
MAWRHKPRHAAGEADGEVTVSGTAPANAVGGSIANSGYIGTVYVDQQLAPQEPAPWPQHVGAIPKKAAPFQHRAEMDRLRAMVERGETTVRTQFLTGMGGTGKTQLAADFAGHASESGELDVLVWITANSRQAILAAYREAGVKLCRGDPNDAESAARSFLAWLSPKAATHPCRWLIVLDDVADPDDLHGLWPPSSPHGRTLVTTRLQDAALRADGGRRIEIGLFTEREALTYLTDALEGRDTTGADLEALASDLGYLPLALAQATAYIINSGHEVTTYRQLLADRATKLTDIAPDRLPDDQSIPLAAAWSLSIDRADSLDPPGLARPMLALTTMLDANGIPQDVLTSEPALVYLGACREANKTAAGAPAGKSRWRWARRHRQEQPVPVAADEAVNALRALHRLSLVRHPTRGGDVGVHQLLQRAVREQVPTRERARLTRAAADALLAAWPEAEGYQPGGVRLRACAQALEGSDATGALWGPEGHEVLFRCGLSLGAAGQFAAAADYFGRLEQTATSSLGGSHLQAIAARANHARWRGRAGDLAGAKQASETLLPIATQALGPDHPVTLGVQAGLAFWQAKAGDIESSARILRDLLPEMVRVHGHYATSTLVVRHEIARRRGQAGDAAGAVEELRELLADMVCLMDQHDPHFLNAIHNLGVWQGRAGDAAEAARVLQDLLPIQTSALGADYPDTLATRHELAWTRGELGEAATAAAELKLLLADRERVLGLTHPDTLTTRYAISHWEGEAGDAAGAAAALADLVPLMVSALGADHPETFIVRRARGLWLERAGDTVGAIGVLRALVDDQAASWGPEHPETLLTRAVLAHYQGEAGAPAGASRSFGELLSAYERVYGPDHTETLTIRATLARWQQETGDATGAITALQDLLSHQARVLGEDHVGTLTTRANLAFWRGRAGDAAGGARTYEQLLPDMTRVLGPEAPDTLVVRSNIAFWHGASGHPARAAAALTDLLPDLIRVLGEDHPITIATRRNVARWQRSQ